MIARGSRLGWTRWLAPALLWLASACSQPTSGPLPIVWGREPCAHCSMAISDPRFAAELRLGPRELLRFDDFGCAVVWLAEHPDADPPQEIWVMDQDREEWLDARAAYFRAEQRTPMAWGFGAIAVGEPGAVDLETARRSVRERASERASRGGA